MLRRLSSVRSAVNPHHLFHITTTLNAGDQLQADHRRSISIFQLTCDIPLRGLRLQHLLVRRLQITVAHTYNLISVHICGAQFIACDIIWPSTSGNATPTHAGDCHGHPSHIRRFVHASCLWLWHTSTHQESWASAGGLHTEMLSGFDVARSLWRSCSSRPNVPQQWAVGTASSQDL